MGGGLDPVLSEGAVRALWSAPPVSARWALSRPVLQVVDVRREPDGSGLRPAPSQYRLLLSDGVYAQLATLSRALSPLAKGDDLRRGSVIALGSYVHHPDPDHVRTIFISQLEILQTECALIGSLKLYKPKPPRNSVVSSTSRSMSYGLRSDFNPGFEAIQMGPSCRSYPSAGDRNSVVSNTSRSMSDGLRSDFNPGFEVIQMGPCGSYPSAGDRNSVMSSTSRSMSYGLSSDFNPGFEAIQMGPSCGSYPSAGDRNSVVSSTSRSMSDGLRSDFNPGFEVIQMGPCGSYPSAGDRNSVVSSTSRSMSYGLSSDFNPWFEAIQMGPSCGSYPSAGDKLSVWKEVGQIKDENLGYSDKPDLITVKAAISSVTDLLFHVACPLVVNGMRCNAKVTGDVDGMRHCNRCGYNFSKPCKYGCSVRIQIQDHTGTASATAYECAAEEILGCMAKDLYSMKYKEHDHAQLDDIMLGAVGKQYVLRLKVERQLFYGVKCIVLKAEKVDPSAESCRLLGLINTSLQEGSGPGSEFRSPTMPTYTGS